MPNDTTRDVTPEEMRALADKAWMTHSKSLQEALRSAAAQVERLNAEIETIEADQGRKINAMFRRAEAAEAQVERLTAERDEFKGLFVEAAEARDKTGCLGSVPDCIALLNESATDLAAQVERLTAERDRLTAAREVDAAALRIATALAAERDALRDQLDQAREYLQHSDQPGVHYLLTRIDTLLAKPEGQ